MTGPRPLDYRSRVYDRYVSSSLREGAEAEFTWIKQRGPYLQRIVKRYFPKPLDAAILDLGCGHGALLYYAQRRGYTNVKGIDRSGEQVELSRRLGISGVIQGDLLDGLRSQPAESYDMVVAVDVIEHFNREELMAVTDQIRRVLRDGGRWLIHVPNGASIFAGGVRYGDLTHELAFTEASIAQLIKASGFREVKCYEDTPVPHGFKSAIRWTLWKVLRFGISFWYAVETGGPLRICSQNLFAIATK